MLEADPRSLVGVARGVKLSRTAGPEEVEETLQRIVRAREALETLLKPGRNTGKRGGTRRSAVGGQGSSFKLPRARLGDEELRKIADQLTMGVNAQSRMRYADDLRRSDKERQLLAMGPRLRDRGLVASQVSWPDEEEVALAKVQAIGTHWAEALAFELLMDLASLIRARWPAVARDRAVESVAHLATEVLVLGDAGSWSDGEIREIECDLVKPLLILMFPDVPQRRIAAAARVATDAAFGQVIISSDLPVRALASTRQTAKRARKANALGRGTRRKSSPHEPADFEVKPTRKPRR